MAKWLVGVGVGVGVGVLWLLGSGGRRTDDCDWLLSHSFIYVRLVSSPKLSSPSFVCLLRRVRDFSVRGGSQCLYLSSASENDDDYSDDGGGLGLMEMEHNGRGSQEVRIRASDDESRGEGSSCLGRRNLVAKMTRFAPLLLLLILLSSAYKSVVFGELLERPQTGSGADQASEGQPQNDLISQPAMIDGHSTVGAGGGNGAEAENRRSMRMRIETDDGDDDHQDAIGKTAAEDKPTIGEEKLKCRMEKDLYLDFEEYKHYSCIHCYNHLPSFLFNRKLVYRKEARTWLHDELQNRSVGVNETELVKATFKNEITFEKWVDCCAKALECCRQNARYLSKVYNQQGQLIDNPEHRNKWCPATWDGLSCWPDSSAGEMAEHTCPDNVYFIDLEPPCRGSVYKECFANGSWRIRNNHEWTNYSQCNPLPHYRERMYMSAGWYLVTSMVIVPALLVLGRLPNRGGSKRVRILQNLLFWLLLNGLFQAVFQLGVVGGIFNRGDQSSDRQPESAWIGRSFSTDQQGNSNHSTRTTGISPLERHTRHDREIGETGSSCRPLVASNPDHDHYTSEAATMWPIMTNDRFKSEPRSRSRAANVEDPAGTLSRPQSSAAGDKFSVYNALDMDGPQLLDATASLDLADSSAPESPSRPQSSPLVSLDSDPTRSGQQEPQQQTNVIKHDKDEHLSSSTSQSTKSKAFSKPRQQQQVMPAQLPPGRPRRSANSWSLDGGTHRQSPLIVIFCWLVTLVIRISRQLGYAWMFTGAVYLCSVLHFAPAEPPTSFIRWLMILTNGLPLATGFIYVIVRTVFEPSPLTFMLQAPYYYVANDQKAIDYLWSTQLKCWMLRSEYDYIEDIIDSPNLVFVILNGGLFILTLIIMCRISRPGSTRQEMSLADYFRAAGTLVVLYGAHYLVVAYKPIGETNCLTYTVYYYLVLFVDGIQGIAVSYVFCYRTQEGKEVIQKWWFSWRDRGRYWFRLNDNPRNVNHNLPKREKSLLGENNNNNSTHSHHSMRSNNSNCNGKDAATELIDIDDPF